MVVAYAGDQDQYSRRSRFARFVSVFAIAALSLTGMTVTASAAYAAAVSTYFCYNYDAAGNCSAISDVTAEQMTGNTNFTGTGYYLCTGVVSRSGKLLVKAGWFVTLILADDCNMSVVSTTGSAAVEIETGGQLVIAGHTGNSGYFAALSGGTTSADVPIRVLYNGDFRAIAGSIRASSTASGSAAIGSRFDEHAGRIVIGGAASVYATAMNMNYVYGCGAGIGTGGSSSLSLIRQEIAISTAGTVRATGCVNSGTGGSGAGIGMGGFPGAPGTVDIATVTAAAPTISPLGSATAQMRDFSGGYTTAAVMPSVAVGSRVTYRVTANSGRVITATGNGVAMTNVNAVTASPRVVQHKVTTATPATQAIVFASQLPTSLALTASPAATQTRPGNVTLTATLQQSSTGVNAKSVSFFQDSVMLGTVQTNALGVANYVVTSPAAGTHAYQAKWLGDTDYAESDSNLIAGYLVVRDTQSALALTGLNTSHVYGDGPLTLATSGGNGTGDVTLNSSNPTVASLSGTTTAGAGTLTLHQAGSFTITQTKAQDDTFLETTRTTPTVTVVEATPVAVLTRTGGDTLTTPVNLTLRVDARGTGATPQGLVQFYLKSTKLGDPLPLVDNLDGAASVSLNGIPLEAMGSQNVSAVFLGDTGKYKTVTKSDTWFLGGLGYCKVGEPA